MIKLKDISLSFTNKDLFSDFSLNVSLGEKVLLDAPSGKGKSTLLKLIMGFTKPDSGEIYIDNMLLTSQSVREIRQKIAYLPQEISIPPMKVIDFIKGVLAYQSNSKIVYNELKIKKMLHDLRLAPDTLVQSTSSLSGGEKQRIGILIMQLLDREIFLLDEVTSALNSELKTFILDYFLKMDKTVIIVSHDQVWQKAKIRRVSW